ncbi:MAG TPA: Sip1-related alpha-galactosidase [Polyangiaceae bacterium]|nr:Sip1-related alpha-galactosidase [Polyangiaceae bacterium]
MTPSLARGSVTWGGLDLLTDVSGEIAPDPGGEPGGGRDRPPAGASPGGDSSRAGLFLVARAAGTSSRHVFRAGSMPGLARFTVCHRYEPYWMRPAAGARLSEVPAETQFFLGRLVGGAYVLLVPLVGDLFRFSLRGATGDRFELLGETGDAFAPGDGGLALYVAAGEDPFALAREGARSVAARLGSGPMRRDKAVPDFVDKFGWCTWDAFYQDVSAGKVREGLERFAEGGVRPRWIILDDGWQSTARRATGESRLTSLSANDKFGGRLAPTIRAAKEEFGVERFLVWHSIVGYWGGVDGERLPGYGVVDQTRQFGEGVLAHAPAFNQVWWGNVVGLVPAAHVARFFDDYHRALRDEGVDGVKVDSQAVLEAVATRQGGRLALTRAYREALEASVERHFGGRIVNCMSNAQETWYGSPRSNVLRSSIDFFPRMPETHGGHLYTNAQVGLWFGEFLLPDWDMFQSGHEWGAYHAAGRAISGGPVYVSDQPGRHDFALLDKLVCSDGTVLRCDGPALPTLDTLLADPTREDTLLKIWNRNGATAVVGVFNARHSPDGPPVVLGGSVGPGDVPGFGAQRCACFAHRARSLEAVAGTERRPVRLAEREFELFTFVPIERGFAAIGLADKLNSAGAIAEARWTSDRACELALRDGGELLGWSESAPAAVDVGDGEPLAFTYDTGAFALRAVVPRRGRCVVRVRW